MKITKTASGKYKLTKKAWMEIGRKAGWSKKRPMSETVDLFDDLNLEPLDFGLDLPEDIEELPIEIEFYAHKGERRTRDYPGSAPYAEIVGVKINGMDIDDSFLEKEAVKMALKNIEHRLVESAASYDEALAEDAEEARMEARRDMLSEG
jgi:hypothetical protein